MVFQFLQFSPPFSLISSSSSAAAADPNILPARELSLSLLCVVGCVLNLTLYPSFGIANISYCKLLMSSSLPFNILDNVNLNHRNNLFAYKNKIDWVSF